MNVRSSRHRLEQPAGRAASSPREGRLPLPILAVTAALGLSAAPRPSAGASKGHLQVKAAIGVTVYVGDPVGLVETQGGVTFADLSPGAHRLLARREGYIAQNASVWIRPDEVTVHRLSPWQRRVNRQGDAIVIVQTLPVDATVSAQALGYEKTTKADEPLIISHVPAGDHKLTFCTEYKCIDYRVQVEPGDLKRLLVLFDRGEVRDQSRAFRDRLVRLAELCVLDRDADDCAKACNILTRLGEETRTCEFSKGPSPSSAASWLEIPKVRPYGGGQ